MSWAIMIAVVVAAAIACCKLSPSNADQEIMRNAGAPARMYLENPRLRKTLGPSVHEVIRSIEGPGYDLSRSVEVE